MSDSLKRAPWVAPTVVELPPLTELTLQTGAPVNGSGSSGGLGFSYIKLLTGRGGDVV